MKLCIGQIKSFHEKAAEEAERFCEDRISEFKEQLDRKEYIIQLKENKWNEIERIMTIYSKNDHILREQLTQLKYLCDDTSAGRGISSVIKENETLRDQLKTAGLEIDNLVLYINELQRSNDDPSLDDIIEEMSEISGGTGSGTNYFNPPLVPTLNLDPVKEKTKDKTNYKQLAEDQSQYIKELEDMNRELTRKNRK